MIINTVLGTMRTEDMGFTLMHEHIINVDWNLEHAFPGFYDRESVVDMFVEDAESLIPYGVKTWIDPTPIGLGRDLKLMQECSRRTGINIICCTGFYSQEYPFMHLAVQADYLAEQLLLEVEQGIEGTNVRPAILKCATHGIPGATENNREMVRAVAIAHKATGLPIYTHTDCSTSLGLWQKAIFDAEGIDPKRIAYCHSGSRCDTWYINALSRDGSYICFDQLSWFNTEEHADCLAEFLKSDMYKQIIISCDADLRSDYGFTGNRVLRDREHNIYVKKFTRRNELFLKMLPRLRERGVPEERINEVFTLNPRRFFGEMI